MAIGSDCRAVEAIPLRLLVVAVVASLSVIPASGALDALRDRSFLDRCVVQIETIVATAEVVALEGEGSRRSVDVDLTTDGSLRMSRLAIGGGPDDPARSSVILELSSGRRLIGQVDEPFAWLASPYHEGLVTRSTEFTLLLTASESGNGMLVICEVVPWTS